MQKLGIKSGFGDVLYSPMVVDVGDLPVLWEELVEGAFIDEVCSQLSPAQRIEQPVPDAESRFLHTALHMVLPETHLQIGACGILLGSAVTVCHCSANNAISLGALMTPDEGQRVPNRWYGSPWAQCLAGSQCAAS